MRVAITGSSGLVGTALSAALRNRGDEVIPVVRRAPTTGEIGWDPSAETIDAKDLDRIDGVVHLAGEGIADKRWSDEQKRRILESRTKGTTTIAKAIAEASNKPTVLISGSAIGYYGDRGASALTESAGPGDHWLSDVCVAWEGATAAAEAAGVRTAQIRTGVVLSTEGGALAKQLPLFKFGLGGVLLPGTQFLSWIHIDDVVGAIMHLLDTEVSGPVNLTAPDPVTNREFTKTLGDVLHRPTLLPIPKFGPKLVLGGELAEALLYLSSNVVPEALDASGYRFAFAQLEPALRSLLGS